MDGPFTPEPQIPADAPAPVLATEDPATLEGNHRRLLLRRLRILLLTGLAAFSLTVWLLVNAGPSALEAGPTAIVQRHLAALNRGDLHQAYEQFSQRYREKLSFDDYHEMVAQHREVFQTRRVEFSSRRESRAYAVLVTRLVAADGSRYLARFTMVRTAGRWWIDEVRWAVEPPSRRLVAA